MYIFSIEIRNAIWQWPTDTICFCHNWYSLNFRIKMCIDNFLQFARWMLQLLHPISKYWIWNAYCQWGSEYIEINYCLHFNMKLKSKRFKNLWVICPDVTWNGWRCVYCRMFFWAPLKYSALSSDCFGLSDSANICTNLKIEVAKCLCHQIL